MSTNETPTSQLPENGAGASQSNTDATSAVKKRKSMKLRSDVWQHYTVFTEDDKKKCKCNYCDKVYFCDSNKNGTSTLWAHNSVCKKVPKSNLNQTTQTSTEAPEMVRKKTRIALGDKFLRQKLENGEIDSKCDLDVYLKESVIVVKNEDFDILKWWKLNQTRFPILCHLARDVLAMPISTVASESAFSTSGRVLDAFRSSLTPKVVEALICAQNWIKKQDVLPSIEQDLNDSDKFEEATGLSSAVTSECGENSIVNLS